MANFYVEINHIWRILTFYMADLCVCMANFHVCMTSFDFSKANFYFCVYTNSVLLTSLIGSSTWFLNSLKYPMIYPALTA